MALPPEQCPECGAARPPRAAGCPRCGRIFQDLPVAAAGVRSSAPAPLAAKLVEPQRDDAPESSGGGCRACLLLAALCALLTLLAGVAFYLLVRDDVRGLSESFERQAAAQDLGRLASALETWAESHGGRLPDTLDELDVVDVSLVDVWDGPIRYEPARDRRSARLISLGADGEPGGEGLDADIELTLGR
jgi:hypothetical protein